MKLLSDNYFEKIKIFNNKKTSISLKKDLESHNCIEYIDFMSYYTCRLIKDRKLAIK